MITVAVPPFWSSPLEDPARSSSFVATEVPALGLNESTGFQLAAFSLHGSQDIFGTEELPSIDESLFDLVEVPELEEIEVNERSSPAAIAPLDDLMLEEIPALEDPIPTEPVLVNDQQWFDWTKQTGASSPVQAWDTERKNPPPPEVSTPIFVVSDDTLFEKEEIVSSSPVATYVDSCGSESPMSCYSAVSDELGAPSEKRRRVSQISMSSYCSSNGDSTWSPTSASDSDVDSRRGGRKSRFSPEDRKERKKAQNRTAAERYRQKRKVQEETIDEEEQQLIDGNNELKTEVTKLQAEVSCLKRLMREVLQAKGVIIPPRKETKAQLAN
ncbi:cyclic AMP-dependent transcription factor ATF-4 [Galendromus occidentalis]|uniref:Cyclic AMP-dependent transcription factor ATF-4 n=1 Tax=Galendromus occidentalis TaxID=34638 RepID=A0AAJ6QWD2_9ACAR|nr:cyclic AMP-dependent transcription factor ATF-4 [Galendromus occidentalis]XP_003746142.1 cyclic AMP-dependent transcription factor ATF-4 [Galendromus occidentalis]XP_003746143.1 cyclic AMP-dependent transcription factor ATF-4 [Galendromus occidentalis]